MRTQLNGSIQKDLIDLAYQGSVAAVETKACRSTLAEVFRGRRTTHERDSIKA
jgi:hypothetical protein